MERRREHFHELLDGELELESLALVGVGLNVRIKKTETIILSKEVKNHRMSKKKSRFRNRHTSSSVWINDNGRLTNEFNSTILTSGKRCMPLAKEK